MLLGIGGIWFYIGVHRGNPRRAVRRWPPRVGGGAGIPEFRARLTSRGLAVMSVVCALAGLAIAMTHREAIRMPGVALLTIALLVHLQKLEATVHRWTRISTIGRWAQLFSLYAIHMPLLFTAVSLSFYSARYPERRRTWGGPSQFWSVCQPRGARVLRGIRAALSAYTSSCALLARLFHV